MASIDSLPDPVEVTFTLPKAVAIYLAPHYAIDPADDDSAQDLKAAVRGTIIQRAKAKGMGGTVKNLLRLAKQRNLSSAEMAEIEAENLARGEDPEPPPE